MTITSLLEPVILSVSGRDRSGVLAALTRVLEENSIRLVDIEQATLQDFLALSFLVDLENDPAKSRAILQRFLSEAATLGLSCEVRSLSAEELSELKAASLWALTLIAPEPTARTVSAVAATAARHQANIVSIRRLAEHDIRAAEFLVDITRVRDLDSFRRELLQEAGRVGVDIALAPEAVYRQSKRVVVMDGDSTLLAGEIIDELAIVAGVGDEVRAITERAMAGEMDFREALEARVSLLRGLTVAQLEEVARAVPLTPGAEETVRALKALGFKVGVISGGFMFFLERLRDQLGLDYVFGNRLEMEDGRVTGRVLPPILDGEGKAQRLREIAALEGVPLTQVVGIGDGANDIPMLQAAGLGVAFRAKESTRREAHGAIHQNSLHGILYLLGVSQRSLAELTKK